jgi:hypothetical protein
VRGLVISLAALSVVAGCSGDREHTVGSVSDTTSQALATTPVDTSVSPAEEPAPSPAATRPPGPTRPSKPLHRSRPRAATTAPAANTDTVSSDTGAARDRVPVPSVGYAPTRDTLPEQTRDSAATADTAERQRLDTAPTPVGDTASAPVRAPAPVPSPAPPPDSARDHDTQSAAPVPSPAPTPAAEQNAHTLPAGTEIRAILNDSINSRSDSAGRVLLAHVAADVVDPAGTTVVPAGAEVQLTITRLEPARSRSASDGKLSLRIDAITIDGRPEPVSATVKPVPHELRGRGVTAGEAEKVGVGAAAGAVVGRVITGKTKGAVVGGVVGAAGGAVVAAQTASRDVVVPSGTTVLFTLAAPLVAATP